MNPLTFTMALLMGFTGSLHCAGMCGPIVWIMPFQAYAGTRKVIALGLYHLGRISVYAFLALVLHSISGFFAPKVQQYIAVVLGGSLLLAGILSFIPNNRISFKLPWAEYVTKKLSSIVGKPGMGVLLVAGILNGLLPCGLVYMALSASITLPALWQSALLMYVFGLGTLPMLLSISLLKSRIRLSPIQHFRKFVPVVVLLFGCLFIVRGMNLGIPYLSPRVTVEHHQLKACCCHKK